MLKVNAFVTFYEHVFLKKIFQPCMNSERLAPMGKLMALISASSPAPKYGFGVNSSGGKLL